jgi:hypothetical protein
MGDYDLILSILKILLILSKNPLQIKATAVRPTYKTLVS